jgi:hypothetical protein
VAGGVKVGQLVGRQWYRLFVHAIKKWGKAARFRQVLQAAFLLELRGPHSIGRIKF